jgi:ubiquinone/menaquinone biosynthesis C-methylase UbiE
MSPHVCPWWGGYFIDNRFRRLLHKPEAILADLVHPGMSVLDFGCGMGFFSIPMARLVGETGRVIAIDLQQQMLTVLAKRANRSGVADRIRTHRCEANALGFGEPVDFALAFYSAHEVPEPRRLVEEIHRCLKPQAQFLLVEPIGHVRAAEFEGFLSLGVDVGFTVDQGPAIRLSRSALLTKASGEREFIRSETRQEFR